MSSFKLYDYQQELVDGARDEIKKGAKGVLIQSAPGSGKSVVIAEIIKKTTDNGKPVLFIVHVAELAAQIKHTLKSHDVDMYYVDILTVGKARNRLNRIREPAIIVTDETHHSKAKTYTEIYEHFDKSIRLGFTATPWRAKDRKSVV